MYQPKIIAIDFETALTDGTPSTEYYRPEFRAVSCAFAWNREDGSVRTSVCSGERAIARFLGKLDNREIELVCHNFSFEYGVLHHRFPGYEKYLKYDTARLVQMMDNGGKVRNEYEGELQSLDSILEELNGVKYRTGLSLVSCVSRFLPVEYHDHKEKYHSIIRDRGGKKGKEGLYLQLLTKEELHAYNTEDAVVTLLLYHAAIDRLGADSWLFDHNLYRSAAINIAMARSHGIKVDRELLRLHIDGKMAELSEIEKNFRSKFASEIEEIEMELTTKAKSARKSDKGKDGVKPVKFNPRSTKQLEKLFCDKLGIKAQFETEKGNPSFSKKFLSQWGEGGAILSNQKKAMIEMKQGERLMEKSEYDGRWHIDLKAAGTSTGRFAGAGGLNVQGLSRRCKSLMSCMVADPGEVFISVDLAAGEPTISTHYSVDKFYKLANFDMVGKEPYWDGEVLVLSDIYLMGASFSPAGRDKILEAWNQDWNGLTFAQQWVKDPTVIQDSLKKSVRNLHKIWVLAIGYGMGKRKLHQSAFEAGYSDIKAKDASEFHKKYWKVFHGIKRFSDAMVVRLEKNGYLENAFGYRLYPSSPHKAFNYMIQSSVSGYMNALCMSLFTPDFPARYLSTIHDEIIMSCKKEDVEIVRKKLDQCVDALNTALNWSVNMRTGFVTGENLYEAK